MIRKLTQQLHVPVSGYRTKTVNKRADGYHELSTIMQTGMPNPDLHPSLIFEEKSDSIWQKN